jgi:secondary thiamine-phosphate synthase enzyme
VQFKEYSIRTSQKIEFINIDDKIEAALKEGGIENGICVVFVPHTTAGVTINENADPSVVRDIVMETNKIVPEDDNYRHSEGNSAAHIKSSLIGPSLALIIDEGKIVYGTWQSVYFCEFDGPRSRRVMIKIVEG